MIQQVTKHVTADGQEFADEAEARQHEAALEIREEARRFAESAYGSKMQVTRAVRVICEFHAWRSEQEESE